MALIEIPESVTKWGHLHGGKHLVESPVGQPLTPWLKGAHPDLPVLNSWVWVEQLLGVLSLRLAQGRGCRGLALPSGWCSYPRGCGLSGCCHCAHSDNGFDHNHSLGPFFSRGTAISQRAAFVLKCMPIQVGAPLEIMGKMGVKGSVPPWKLLTDLQSCFSHWEPPVERNRPELHRGLPGRWGEPEAEAMTAASRFFYQRPKADSPQVWSQ